MLDRPVAPVLEALAARGIDGGFDLVARTTRNLGQALLVCATETQDRRGHRRLRGGAGRGACSARTGSLKETNSMPAPEQVIFEYSRPPAAVRAASGRPSPGAAALADRAAGACAARSAPRCPR